MVRELLLEKDPKKAKKMLKRIKKYEEISDRIEIEVTEYLTKVSQGKLSNESSQMVRVMLSICNDLERVGDICYQMSINLERKIESKIWFASEQRKELLELFDLVDEANKMMDKNIGANYKQVQLDAAYGLEEDINKKRDAMRVKHLQSIEKGEYNYQSGMIYNDLFSSLEKIGDHVINVSEAMSGKI